METEPNFELLKDAYAIIDGIPETAIAFGPPRSKEGASLGNGTICSPEGWLAQHPMFRERGLSMSADGTQLLLEQEQDTDSPSASVMARVFGLAPDEAQQLFGERDLFTSGDDSGLSDKSLWLQRVRDYLYQKEQVDEPAESSMLAAQLRDRGMTGSEISPSA